MVVIEYATTGVSYSGYHKLSEFDCYLIVLMILQLNLNNLDLAFCFGVSQTSLWKDFKEVDFNDGFKIRYNTNGPSCEGL